MSLQWIAYRTVSNGAYEKKVSIPMWTTGTECVREDFPKVGILFKKVTLMLRSSLHDETLKLQKLDQLFAEETLLLLLVLNRRMHFFHLQIYLISY